jgi:hypothetical protein
MKKNKGGYDGDLTDLPIKEYSADGYTAIAFTLPCDQRRDIREAWLRGNAKEFQARTSHGRS